MGQQVGRIGQIALGVGDLSRSIAFWRDAVGLKFLFEAPNVAFFDVAGVRLMLGAGDERTAAPPSGVVLYFETVDLDASFAGLRDRGATVEREPHRVAKLGTNDLWMAFLRDPDGHLFALMSERPAA